MNKDIEQFYELADKYGFVVPQEYIKKQNLKKQLLESLKKETFQMKRYRIKNGV